MFTTGQAFCLFKITKKDYTLKCI